MPMVKMIAMDSFHSDSTVPPGPHEKGERFEVNDDFAKTYAANGFAEYAKGGNEKAAKTHQNKATGPDENKGIPPLAMHRSGGQHGANKPQSSSRAGQAHRK